MGSTVDASVLDALLPVSAEVAERARALQEERRRSDAEWEARKAQMLARAQALADADQPVFEAHLRSELETLLSTPDLREEARDLLTATRVDVDFGCCGTFFRPLVGELAERYARLAPDRPLPLGTWIYTQRPLSTYLFVKSPSKEPLPSLLKLLAAVHEANDLDRLPPYPTTCLTTANRIRIVRELHGRLSALFWREVEGAGGSTALAARTLERQRLHVLLEEKERQLATLAADVAALKGRLGL